MRILKNRIGTDSRLIGYAIENIYSAEYVQNGKNYKIIVWYDTLSDATSQP